MLPLWSLVVTWPLIQMFPPPGMRPPLYRALRAAMVGNPAHALARQVGFRVERLFRPVRFFPKVNTGSHSSFRLWQETRAARAASAINIFLMALESEINVQHVVGTRHIEILRVKAVEAFLGNGVVHHTGLLVTAGLDVAVVQQVLHVQGEAQLVFALDVPGLADGAAFTSHAGANCSWVVM